MTNTASPYAAIFVAFLLGCVACLAPVPSLKREPRLVTLPDSSAIPRSGLGDPESAYAAIPHRRTMFQPQDARLDASQAAYLQLMFDVIDEATVVRVAALESLLARNSVTRQVDAYDDVIDFAAQVRPPGKLSRYHRLIVDAMQHQVGALREMDRQQILYGEPSDDWIQLSDVRCSSSKLQSAYRALMKGLPRQPQVVCDAFFDYHCALDFK